MTEALALPFDGSKLREIRERAGLTRRDVASLCKVNGQTVSVNHLWRLETGKYRTSAPLLKALAAALSVEIDALLTPAAPSNSAATP